MELGQVDILTEVTTLASHVACPRVGHLEATLHLLSYLKGKHNARLVLDLSYGHEQVQEGRLEGILWRRGEVIPRNCPDPMSILCIVMLILLETSCDGGLDQGT